MKIPPAPIVPRVVTKPVRVKGWSEPLQSHIITGIGYSWSCTCGQRGRVRSSYRDAMADGREHAAGHPVPRR